MAIRQILKTCAITALGVAGAMTVVTMHAIENNYAFCFKSSKCEFYCGPIQQRKEAI